jgi:hypothetical protein
MPIADYHTALRAALESPTQVVTTVKALSGAGTRWQSPWTFGAQPAIGATPGAGAVCTNATLGALAQSNKSGGATEQRAWLRQLQAGRTQAFEECPVMLVDRLSHVGGLTATVDTPQAAVTAALTRYTDGVGVVAMLEAYTAISGSTITISGTYDSDSGTGHTFPASTVSNGEGSGIGTLRPLALQLGDRGVKAVSSITMTPLVATGTFGITLFKPLWIYPCRSAVPFSHNGHPLRGNGGGGMPVVRDDACLQLLFFKNSTASGSNINADLAFFEI